MKTNANAFDDWCHCTAFNKCSLQDVTTSQWYAHAQICQNAFPGVTFYCDASHQKEFVEDINKLTCPGDNKYVDSGQDCGCQKPWEVVEGSGTGGTCSCWGDVICPGACAHFPHFPDSVPDNSCNENYEIYKSKCPKGPSDYLDIRCNTGGGFYQTSTLRYTTRTDEFDDLTNCQKKINTQILYSGCQGCSTEPCKTNTLEWRNCSYSDMNCFGTGITICEGDVEDGTNGCYDKKLYERQVGYTFDASANNGNGSCTIGMRKNQAWRCKQGYYPINILDEYNAQDQHIDINQEPNFRCVPCPVGWAGKTYSSINKNKDEVKNNSTDIEYLKSFVSDDSFNTCTKCPAGFSTFSSGTYAPLEYYEGAVNCEACPSGYFNNNSTQNIDVTVYKIYDVAIKPAVNKTGNGCALCLQNEYSTQDRNNGTTSCTPCPDAFITDEPKEDDRTTHNVSVKKCYIDTNVMLSDSLGKIKLSEEIGSGTQLYHQ